MKNIGAMVSRTGVPTCLLAPIMIYYTPPSLTGVTLNGAPPPPAQSPRRESLTRFSCVPPSSNGMLLLLPNLEASLFHERGYRK